jgi:hypothetical protein
MKKQSEIEIIIRSILGKDKFLMLNLKLVKELTPNGACFLTYLLDKYEYLVKSSLLEDYDGMYLYRREITNKLSLSPYQQRNIEADLKSRDLIDVKEERIQGETFNKYYLKISNIYELVEGLKDTCSA